MSTVKPFGTIAAAIAFSPNMEANIYESVRIKEMLGDRLILIHISDREEEGERCFQQILLKTGCNVKGVTIVCETGDTVSAILKVTEEYRVDLLIAGALPREGILKYYMGSIARKLARKSNCSILLMIRPDKLENTCSKIVVNGVNHPKTPYTVKTAVQVAKNLGSSELIIVEELDPSASGENYDGDEQLEKMIKMQWKLRKKGIERIQKIIDSLPPDIKTLSISKNVIFGKKGYTIGHFTQAACADLLVMNSADTKLGFLDRIFPHDLEYILWELPSDILIVHSTEKLIP